MKLPIFLLLLTANTLFAQKTSDKMTESLPDNERWQQRAEYQISVNLDHKKHHLKGKTTLKYTNNSPDDLRKAFFHLYFNAFQPSSAMDIRSRTIADPDPRVGSRIQALNAEEIGYQNVQTLKLNGKPCTFSVEGTILEVILPEPIKAHSSVTFDMDFVAQVPKQIRRSGRDNKEGIDYSMTQWYPKMCEYDYQGWHANPYIGREFYGIWGNFEVNITADKALTIGGTGILQNPNEIGKGYETEGAKINTKPDADGKLTWKFKATNVHDFAWAADTDYTHVKAKGNDGTTLHFIYKKTKTNEDSWARLPNIMAQSMNFIAENFGKYPYSDFTIIQGGDGGMEYPMSTLITGERPLNSLVGVSVHEMMHSWYQGVLGTNESLYGWMDEGFTTYAESYIEAFIKKNGWIPNQIAPENPMADNVSSYIRFALSGREEALSTHADHFTNNTSYSVASYIKGSVFLEEVKYIVGEETFKKGLLKYWDTWQFHHPNVNDVVRVFERQSDLELDWFKEYYVNTTHQIDYAVDTVIGSKVMLRRIGKFPMPLDVLVTYSDGSQEIYNIALDLMRGNKAQENKNIPYIIAPDWQWVNPTYELNIKSNNKTVKSVEIDPSYRLADVNRDNNKQ